MNKPKTKLVISSLLLAFSMVALVTSAYAWFVVKSDANDLGFQILQIDSQINVFKGIDGNSNGVLDSLDKDSYGTYITEEGNASYERGYYTEKNKFEFVDSKYALSANTSANTISEITLTDLAPSKIYTIKFEITNYSAYENTMTFKFMEEEFDDDTLAKLYNIQSRIGTVDANGKVTYVSEWENLASYDGESYSYSGLELTSSVVISKSGSKVEDGRLDCWVQIKIKDDASYSSFSSSTSISLPDYNIVLSMSGED